ASSRPPRARRSSARASSPGPSRPSPAPSIISKNRLLQLVSAEARKACRKSEGRSPRIRKWVFVRVEALLCFVAVSVAVSACRKGPAAQSAASGATLPAAGRRTGTPPAAQTAPAPPKPVPVELPAIVARVNGEDVKKEDFERMITTIESRAGQPIPPDRRDEILRGALDQLVVYTLLSQESKARG